RLQISLVLDQLLGAAMQETDVRIDPLHHLAIELQNKPQHAMRGRVLRSEIDREIAVQGIAHSDLDRLAVCRANVSRQHRFLGDCPAQKQVRWFHDIAARAQPDSRQCATCAPRCVTERNSKSATGISSAATTAKPQNTSIYESSEACACTCCASDA